MQNLGLKQSLSQRLSPQQIQFIKLLQVPISELDTRVEQELEINPALEEGPPEEDAPEKDQADDSYDDNGDDGGDDYQEGISVDEYLRDDDVAGYKMQGDGPQSQEDRELPIAGSDSLMDSLLTQLGYLKLDETSQAIGRQIIGSLDEDGYLRRALESIANDLAFSMSLTVEEVQVERILLMIQQFDPPGIAARTLQECLTIQLERRLDESPAVELALRIVEECFEEFTKKHFDKIQRRLGVEVYDDLKEAVRIITHLNPKPGESGLGSGTAQYIIPDFILVNNAGKLELSLNTKNAPEVRVSRSYTNLLEELTRKSGKNREDRETVTFVKQKLDSARWFIDALKQRQNTLLRTMQAILDYQQEYFIDGDESKLRPMILKDIADQIGMDISTVSRVANSKFIQTEFGVFSLKHFFSEAIHTEAGEDISSREVKQALREMIEAEDKRKPLSDDKLEEMLAARGFTIARRTVAKYREQLNMPVARLRREA